MRNHELPKEYVLKGRTVELRWLGVGDGEALVRFARGLPPNDLLFLQE